jgi:hypothetical protein
MRMDPDDIKNYPSFHEYVSVRIPQVRTMPFIINALIKFSGNGNADKIKDALLWNRGPLIELVDDLDCGGVSASGCYTDGVNKIQIDEDAVQQFEDGKGMRHTGFGKLVYYVGVTLLHELCHWANDGTGKDDLTHEKFEQTLYGKVINWSGN